MARRRKIKVPVGLVLFALAFLFVMQVRIALRVQVLMAFNRKFVSTERDLHFALVRRMVPSSQAPVSLEILLGSNPKGRCGRLKCFFPAVNEPHIGYLVAQGMQIEGMSQYEVMQGNWQFGEKLQTQYHQKHLLLEPPRRVHISEQFATDLNSHLVFFSNSSWIPPRYTEGMVAIQKTQMAPEGSVLFGCSNEKTRRRLPEYRRLLQSAKDHESWVSRVLLKREPFLTRVIQQVEELKVTIKKEPCLASDLQMMIFPDGEFYLLDLDNCGRTPKTIKMERKKKCKKNLGLLKKGLLENLEVVAPL